MFFFTFTQLFYQHFSPNLQRKKSYINHKKLCGLYATKNIFYVKIQLNCVVNATEMPMVASYNKAANKIFLKTYIFLK